MGNAAALEELFGIKDCEIVKTEELSKDEQLYKKIYLIYSGYIPGSCPKCGRKMYKHGARHSTVSDTPLFGYPVELDIQFPRMRCSSCNELWQPEFESIDEKRKLTNRAFLDITQKSLRNTFDDVTNDYMLTANTVKNVFVDFMTEYNNKMRFKTPAFLGIDEIKIKKLGEITVITDLEHRTLFDMLQGRNQKSLTEYFKNLPDRDKVLWVCSDMYRPFERSIRDAMPNARWTIDHFHVVMKANEAVDAVRRIVQESMDKRERIQTKRGMAYTLKTRRKNLTPEEAEKIRLVRMSEKHEPLAIAFDLKEDFFDIYDKNPISKDNAIQSFLDWKDSIPVDNIYDKFRELAQTVHNFNEQIFQYWDCPIAISNGYTECTNRLIRESNIRGRGYSFEVLRGRTLYRKANLNSILKNGLAIGPLIDEYEPVFRFDSTKEEDDIYDEDDYEPFPDTEE
ncbi:MAG: ISL3 family transposase [Clostridia bacterium]|nr:ISL3 family transposase [Clostridia bacterium]